jgi:hypothetical protein
LGIVKFAILEYGWQNAEGTSFLPLIAVGDLCCVVLIHQIQMDGYTVRMDVLDAYHLGVCRAKKREILWRDEVGMGYTKNLRS